MQTVICDYCGTEPRPSNKGSARELFKLTSAKKRMKEVSAFFFFVDSITDTLCKTLRQKLSLTKMPDELLSHAIDALVQIEQANSPEKVIELRLKGVFRLLQYTDKLMAHFYCESPIIRTVFMKKLEFIRAAKSQKEMKEIFSYSAPHYDGNRFRADSPYHIDEEELLQWSMASERYPPSSIVANRVEELFQKIFGKSILEL